MTILTLKAAAMTAALCSLATLSHGLEPISVIASADDGNPPANTLDKNLNTRWSANGDGQWIQYDLGGDYTISSVNLAFYSGDQRTATVAIQTSLDAVTWTEVWLGAQPKLSRDLQLFDFPDISGRYVRVVGYGNSRNSWNSITEAEISAQPSQPTPSPSPSVSPTSTPTPASTPTPVPTASPGPLPAITASASSSDSNVPANTLDGDLNTRWSASGQGQWIEFDLGVTSRVNGLDIAFFKGDSRTTSIEIIAFDQTRANSKTVWTKSQAQPQSTRALQYYDTVDADARYIRIIGYGNSSNSWNSLTEVRIPRGSTPSSSPSPQPSATPSSIPSVTPSPTPTPSVAPSATPTPTPIPTPSGGPSPLPQTALNTVPDINCSAVVSTVSQVNSALSYNMTPGTTLCLADGTYRNLELEFGGIGTKAQPITVAAQNPGMAIISGDAHIRISGEYVVVQGLSFKGGNSASSDLVQTRGGGRVCNHCRITEMTVMDWDNNFTGSNKWFIIYGQYNRIDHSWFSGKKNVGAMMIVDRVSLREPDYAQIDHNYFGDRPPKDGKPFPDTSDNELEGVRVGTSGTHREPSYTRVEYNYFERMQGEAEVISNKSSFNVISHNTVRESYGSIVARHGSDVEISHNFIFGDAYPLSGGIRVADANHKIYNNYIEGCSFAASNFNGGIVLTDSDGSSDSGYQQVDNVFIAHNTIVNCANSLNFAGGKSKASRHPTNITLVNNVIANASGAVIRNAKEGLPNGSSFKNNIFYSSEGLSDDGSISSIPGVNFVPANLQLATDGLHRPNANSPVVDAGTTDYGTFYETALDSDMDGQDRSLKPDIGADEISSTVATKRPLQPKDVGPKNYRP